MVVEYKAQTFTQESFTFPIESFHIYGHADVYKEFLNAHGFFTKDPVVIFHDQGHQFPRALAEEDFTKLKDFIRLQYVKKYGDDEGFGKVADKY